MLIQKEGSIALTFFGYFDWAQKSGLLTKKAIFYLLDVAIGYLLFLVDKDLKNVPLPVLIFFLIRVDSKKHHVRPDYLTWYINHKQAQRYFSQHVAGAALPHVNRTTLESLPVILPPLAVQDRMMKAHYCRLKEKALLETLIEKKTQFLDELLDQTLAHYSDQGESA